MAPPNRRGRTRRTPNPKTPPLVIEGSRRVSGFTEIPTLLRRLGADPEAVLRCAGLPPRALDDPGASMSYASIGALFGCATLATGIEHFGLLSGCAWRLDHIGIVGQLVRNSQTFGDALQSAVLHHWLNGAGGAPFLFRAGPKVEIGYALYESGIAHSDHVYDAALSAWLMMIREVRGPGWVPSQVFLPRSRPANLAPYQRTFGAPISFNSDYAALRFPASQLAERLEGADPERLAATLSLSRRTLDRRLKAHDLSFQAVLDGVRFETVCQLLEISNVGISSIARTLGYAEPSPFTRAFKRWSGLTPSELRRRRVS